MIDTWFCAVDLETTGFDPNVHQILEIGIVAWTLAKPLETFEFSTLVKHSEYHGDAFALAMNAEILGEISDSKNFPQWIGASVCAVRNFLIETTGSPRTRPHPVGFNVCAFDIAFLKNAGLDVFHHRGIELGSALSLDGVPVTSNRAAREILSKEVGHRALADARDAYRIWLSHYTEHRL